MKFRNYIIFIWDDRLSAIIDRQQLYFIKPGNSVLFPPINGFREWTSRSDTTDPQFAIQNCSEYLV